jgi:hypothetical protein
MPPKCNSTRVGASGWAPDPLRLHAPRRPLRFDTQHLSGYVRPKILLVSENENHSLPAPRALMTSECVFCSCGPISSLGGFFAAYWCNNALMLNESKKIRRSNILVENKKQQQSLFIAVSQRF